MFDKLGLWDMCSVMSFFSGANVPHPTSVKLGIPLIMSSWSWSRPTNDSLSKLLMGFAFILRYARGMFRISFGIFWNWLPFRYNVWTLNSWENASVGKSDIPVLAKSNTCNSTFFSLHHVMNKKHSNLPGDLLNTLRRFRCFDQSPIKDYYSTQAFLASLNTEKNSGAKNVYYCILTSGLLTLVHHL